MSFVRPEAQRVLHQWRDAIIGGVAVAIGAYWSFSTGPILRWVAVLMIVGGGAVLWNGIRRARLPRAGGGAGVVQVDERQITYLAAEQGGIISIDDLIRVEIHANGKGFDWLFQTAGMALLRIPGNAEGADSLYDALAALSGANIDLVTEANTSNQRDIFLIWQRDRRALH